MPPFVGRSRFNLDQSLQLASENSFPKVAAFARSQAVQQSSFQTIFDIWYISGHIGLVWFFDESFMADAHPWTSLAAEALLELGRGALSRAAEFFLSASDVLSVDRNSGSPCMAFVQNNLGVAFLLQSKMREARSAFECAQSEWEATRLLVEGAEIAPPVASSGYHLRLASHHGGAFADAHRRSWISLLDVASEITRANAAKTFPDTKSAPIDADVIARKLGHTSFAATLARSNDHELSPRELGDAYRRFHDLACDLLATPQPHTLAFAIERAADLNLLAHPRLALLHGRSLPDGAHPHHHDPRET